MRVAGFGFRTGASLASLKDALERAGHVDDLASIATVSDKAEVPVFRDLGAALNLPIHAVTPEAIAAAPVTTHSEKSLSLRGTGSLSEAAALAAAGAGATLLAPRAISSDKMATCAIAEKGGL